jgi:hydroxymethylglutaryl-CoA reductase
MSESKSSRIGGFYNLTLADRLQQLVDLGWIDDMDLQMLSRQTTLTTQQADHMVENVIGLFALPMGIAINFMINGRDVLVPMVIEEPSVIAGASFMAKLARAGGGFQAQADPPIMIGQLQILNLNDPQNARLKLLDKKDEILNKAAHADPVLQSLGGGPKDIEIRIIEESPYGKFLVLHLLYDVRDAMGANAINTALEKIAPMVEEITGGKVHLKILSNLADRRLAHAHCTIPTDQLGFEGYSGEEVRDGILNAWAFAVKDPYRAATHNKGIMNGIDAVVIASGNDWRAVEAGAHAFAARSGQYTSLSTWEKDSQGNLAGSLELPLAVGIIGGATKVLPMAKFALKLMGVQTAQELAEIIVSVGLAQNLAALRALSSEGIQRGHMTLHARQIALSAGAQGDEIEKLANELVAQGVIRIDRAEQILQTWRKSF